MIDRGRETKMVALRELREQGWTDLLVKQFLPIPDDVRPNPHYPTAAPMKLYARRRIEAIEATKDFKKAKREASKRQGASRKAVETKREKSLEWARALPMPALPDAPREELLRLAIDSYNNYWAWRDDAGAKWASVHDSEELLQKIAVNYVRHKLRDYESRLLQAFGRAGREEAAAVIRDKILDAIGIVYPWLSEECDRQKGAGS
jgi:hypothetical protein